MTLRVLPMIACSSVCICIAACSNVRADETPPLRPESDSVELLFVSGERPSRLAFKIDVDGVPLDEIWEATFSRICQYFDHDGNGSLDEAESNHLPSAFALRQILWGRFSLHGGTLSAFGELDADASGAVTREELANYYRRSGLGSLITGVGKTSTTDALNDALIHALDSNQNGVLEESECQSAMDLVERLDSNDDEQVGAGELVSKSAYPNALGSTFLRAAATGDKPNPVVMSLPFLLLPQSNRDAQSMASRLVQTCKPGRAQFGVDQVAKALDQPPQTRVIIRATITGDRTEISFDSGNSAVQTGSQLTSVIGEARFILRSDSGKLASQTATASKNAEALFAECDTNSDGALDDLELAAPRARSLAHFAIVADRDHNHRVTHDEFSAWQQLLNQVAKGHLMLTVIDHGHGLFELLDADHDGALSRRELCTAVERLRTAGCLTDGQFVPEALPQHLLATISHGQPQSSLGRSSRQGPEWFLAMDRNGDGDVSRREFTGPTDVFHKFDLNQDGFLETAEVAPKEEQSADRKSLR